MNSIVLPSLSTARVVILTSLTNFDVGLVNRALEVGEDLPRGQRDAPLHGGARVSPRNTTASVRQRLLNLARDRRPI